MYFDRKNRASKGCHEQGVASWINYINQTRLDEYADALKMQDTNLEKALDTLDETLETIKEKVITPNRGGVKGQHGFIAEVAECGIENARQEVEGKVSNCVWVNDNGPVDIIRDGVSIQQKFVNSGNHLSLQAIKQHHDAYPEFLRENGKYQIPADHYNKIRYLLSISKNEANKMETCTADFSLKQWKEVHDFFENEEIKISDIEPSTLEYKEVQSKTIEKTISNEKEKIKKTDHKKREEAYAKSKPTLREGLKTSAVSAGIEGGITFGSLVISKLKDGISIRDFTKKDWKEIEKESLAGTAKGGARGASIYVLSNFTSMPASVANLLFSASVGIAQQAFLFKKGIITIEDFVHNSELLCVDATVSALSSFVGQTIIPVPVIGAVVGSTIGNLIYKTVTDTFNSNDAARIREYLREIDSYAKSLDEQYGQYASRLNACVDVYLSILNTAFSMDCMQALVGSIQLAEYVGVPNEEMLRTISDIDYYFLN